MQFLHNYWYVAARAEEVGDTPLARTILDEAIVMFRGPDGKAIALEDRCCHRHLPLSEGAVVDGTIRCGYHGLRFDGTGACIEVPGQTRVPPGALVKSYPVIERHPFVWLWMGDPAAADPAALIDFPWFEAPGRRERGELFHANCNYALLVDNLMNFTHLTYVHGTTIGNAAVTDSAEVTTKRDGDRVRIERNMHDVPPPPTYAAAGGIVGNVDRFQRIQFTPPSYVWVNAGVVPLEDGGSNGLAKGVALERHTLHAITPETGRSTHYFWATAHDLNTYDEAAMELMHDEFCTAFTEDLGILEAQQKSMERHPGAPSIDTNNDSGGLEVTRILERLIAAEAA